jgi:hypothetical protein
MREILIFRATQNFNHENRRDVNLNSSETRTMNFFGYDIDRYQKLHNTVSNPQNPKTPFPRLRAPVFLLNDSWKLYFLD